MSFEIERSATTTTLVLSGRLGIQQARALWDELQPEVADRKPVRLRAAALDALDTSIVQILVQLGDRLSVAEASSGFHAALQARGMENIFRPGPPAVEAAPQVPAAASARRPRKEGPPHGKARPHRR